MLWIKILLQKCNNDSVTVHLFLHLLITSDSSGTVATTLQKLALELRTTVDKIRIRLKRLIDAGLITKPTTNQQKTLGTPQSGTYITICNYESYTMLELWQSHGNPMAIPWQSQEPKEKNKENIPPTPPIKERKKEKYSSSSSSACACEENFIEILKRDRIWGEVVEMRYQLQPNSLGKWINDFSLDLQCRDVAHKNLQDAKRHFCDWLRIQLKAKSNGQRTHTTSNTDRERIIRERQEQHMRDIEKLNADYLAKIGRNSG